MVTSRREDPSRPCPKRVAGYARSDGEGLSVELKKTEGHYLPLEDRSIDLAYTVTVLQENVNPASLSQIIAELCRVTDERIVIMEDIGATLSAPDGSSGIARPIEEYRTGFTRHGFVLLA
jgi:hypothetical protein